MLNSVTVPTVQAILEMKRKNYSAAIDALTSSVSYDFGVPSGLAEGSIVYHRGLAYLGWFWTRCGGSVSETYRQPWSGWYLGLVAPCSLGLARTYAHEAQAAKGTEAEVARAHAKTAYQEFFSLWKNADSDIPILKQAKAEYAKLQ